MIRLGFSRRSVVLSAALSLAGCGMFGKPKEPAAPPAPPPEKVIQFYLPASRPADAVTDALPQSPQDAQPSVPLKYSVEIWETLMPRGSVSADEAFWKRVDEATTPETQQLLKNGIRTGELPFGELEAFRKMTEDRGGRRLTYNGVAGRQVEISVAKNVPGQTVFFHNRDDALIGRTWDRCENLWYFSFETTPRNPDRVRISFAPSVRSNEKRLTYAVQPGKADREIKTIIEQSNYDVSVGSDLRLDKLMVIAPSPAAASPLTIGGTFLMDSTPSEQRERVMLIIPHAFRISEPDSTAGR